jgi:hypothetical protein
MIARGRFGLKMLGFEAATHYNCPCARPSTGRATLKEEHMTRSRALAPALAAVLALALAASAQAQAPKTFNVSDAAGLVKAIGPDRTVVLKKGDYKLSTAYSVTSDYASWTDGDDGKELALTGLKNLTIRGADGARIVSDAAYSPILGVYDSTGVTIDHVAFARSAAAAEDAGASGLSAESVEGLTLDRCTFEAGTTVAIDLWSCTGVRIRRTEVSDAGSGALSASYCDDIEVSDSTFSGCEGYPLVYLEETNGVLFKSAVFQDNFGGNLVEIYAEEIDAESISFMGCDFTGNDFDYFAGSSILPTTDSCEYTDNSFGEDWEISSVAPASDEEYYGEDYSDDDYAYDEFAYYDHPSGLSFTYPSSWELQEYPSKSRAGFFAPYGSTFVLVLAPYQLPAKADPVKQRPKIFADALAALVKSLKDESSVALSVKADGESYESDGMISQDYLGTAAKAKDERAAARVRLVIFGQGVLAVVGMAKDASSLEIDTEADSVFSSITVTE